MSARSTHPRSLVALILMTLIGGLLLAAPTSAQAAKAKAPKVYCKGFSSCEKKGFSTRGYRAVHQRQHWGAVAGHNCTNYAAYRLTSRGRVTDRAATIGSASEWGITLPKAGIAVRHRKPKVGDIAWWSYHRKSVRRSHVAYVERVYKDGSVLVSEDNYKGTFYYTRYYKGHRLFPSSFLRVKKSSGSPIGHVTRATTKDRLVRVESWHSQADNPSGAVGVVSFGGPRGAAGTVQVRTSRAVLGTWWAARSFPADAMPKIAYVYALNTPGTRGGDSLLGTVAIAPH
ncbi:CHAP domain-containing protein [Aeromicrobium sp. UC242_57]|uniref:CHAP domain-containing protein n=1 Tax=Aeromicrobium sp. UC242_57 TaxID=3374624 RepID=UPI0037B08F94